MRFATPLFATPFGPPLTLAYPAVMRDYLSQLSPPPWLMGILNITPDSFSDGNHFLDPAVAVAQARRLVAQGATILDLGAEASSFFRPGVTEVSASEQLRRLLPVLEQLATGFSAYDSPPFITLDTRSSLVVRQGLAVLSGAHAEPTAGAPPPPALRGGGGVNDISAGTHDPAMFEVVAELGVPVVLMHVAPGYPATAEQDDPDIMATVREYLAGRVAAAMAAGIRPENILLDPGIGFGKTMADNWRLLAGSSRIVPGAGARVAREGYPLVLGLSRKRFLDPDHWSALPEDLPETPALRACLDQAGRWGRMLPPELHHDLHPRDLATAALTAWAAAQGSFIHRVHNVALAAWALKQNPK